MFRPEDHDKDLAARKSAEAGFLATCFTWLQYAANHHEFDCTLNLAHTQAACHGSGSVQAEGPVCLLERTASDRDALATCRAA